ncbi:MAG: AraC family transcriptional regulator [Clostridia bacterium]
MAEDSSFLNDYLVHSLSFQYVSGSVRNKYIAHRTDWRRFPFTVIVCAYEQEYFCEVRDRGTFRVRDGGAVIIPPGFIHRVGMHREGTLSYAHIQFTILDGIDVLSFFEVPFTATGPAGKRIQWHIERLQECNIREGDAFAVDKMVLFKGAAFGLLSEIIGLSKPIPEKATLLAGMKKVLPVLRHIRNHLDGISGRKELAEVLNLSETRFHYFFKDIMGVSPMAYVQALRLQKAQWLLDTTDQTIGQIARLVGYSDTFHFSRQFKKKTGRSPSAYRNAHAGQPSFNMYLSNT